MSYYEDNPGFQEILMLSGKQRETELEDEDREQEREREWDLSDPGHVLT